MACTIVATPGAANATSYATIAEGDAYHETHLYGDTWNDADSSQQCQALQMATRLLDSWFDWNGATADGDQALLWPRSGAIGPNGYLLASDEIPTQIKNATAELARQLITSDRTADSAVEVQGLKSLTAGPVSMTFANATSKPIPDSVLVMLSHFGSVRSRSGAGGLKVYRA